MSPISVFLSHRTRDTGDLAALIAPELKEDLGLENVYFAPTDNELYSLWTETIHERLSNSAVLLALVGPSWAGCAGEGEHGNCIHDEADWVRYEVAFGLRDLNTNVLPVLVGVSSLDVQSLPEDVAELADTQGIRFSGNRFTPDDHQRLLVGCWLALLAGSEERVLFVVGDDTDEAEVAVDKLVDKLRAEGLADARELSATVNDPRGMRAIPLREAADRWPDVIAISPSSPSAVIRARLETVISLTGVKELTFLGAGAGLATSGILDSLSSVGDLVVRDVPAMLRGSGRISWWQSLGTGAKVAGGALIASAAIATGVLAQPSPATELRVSEPYNVEVDQFVLPPGAEQIDELREGNIEQLKNEDIGGPFEDIAFEYLDSNCQEPGCDMWPRNANLDPDQYTEFQRRLLMLTSNDGGRTYTTGPINLYELGIEPEGEPLVTCDGDPLSYDPAEAPETYTMDVTVQLREEGIAWLAEFLADGASCDMARFSVTGRFTEEAQEAGAADT